MIDNLSNFYFFQVHQLRRFVFVESYFALWVSSYGFRKNRMYAVAKLIISALNLNASHIYYICAV